MARKDSAREISRLMSEISSLNARILENVYRRAWDRDLLRSLHLQVEEKKRELQSFRAATARAPDAPAEITQKDPAGEDALTTHDTRLIANALYTQRPLIYQSDEWPAFKRVCVALVRLFAFELQDSGDFDSIEFLTHCGLTLKDAEEISRHPGDYIRRSDEFLEM